MTKPIMAKATAVWLIDNTVLTFTQIANFCGLHELEVQGVADGDVASGVKGFDPTNLPIHTCGKSLERGVVTSLQALELNEAFLTEIIINPSGCHDV